MTRFLLSVWVSTTLTACSFAPQLASQKSEDESPAPKASSTSTNAHRKREEPPELKGPLSVEGAVDRALTFHPELAASRARIEAATGRKVQAGVLPNPVFSATMESARTEGKTTADTEYPIGITQSLPIGGRLDKAAKVEATRERRLLAELDQHTHEVERQVRGAFAAALFTEDALTVERELLAGAEESAQIAEERVAAGDAAGDEQARAELEAARAQISLRQAEMMHKRALIELRGALGQPELTISELTGSLETTLSLPAMETVLANLEKSPVLRARALAIEESQARVLREEASRIPDLDVGFFYRRLEETNEDGFDVGVSIPIPIFDRRQGAIQSARAEVLEAEAEYKKAGMSVAATVQSLYWKLAQELETARLFREELSPRSETVLRAATERYRAGETSLNELIPIRRDHRELRLSYLKLLRHLAVEWAEFRSLLGTAD